MFNPTSPWVRWGSVLICLALSALFFSFLPKLTMDNSNKSFFKEDDPARALLERFQATFGNEEFVYLLIDGDKPLSLATYQRLASLAGQVEKRAPHLKRVLWLGNVEVMRNLPDGVLIEPLFAKPPRDQAQLDAGVRKALANPAIVGDLLSRDAKATALLVELEPFPENDHSARTSVWPALREILAEFDDLDVLAVGGPVIAAEFDRIGAEESSLFGLLSLAVAAVLLALLSRSVIGVIFPVLVMLISLIWALGSVAMLGWPLTLAVILLPTLLICVSVGDSLHIISDYQSWPAACDKTSAMKKTLKRIATPVIFTSITTVAGLLSFWVTPIKPLSQMGVYASLGVLYAMALSLAMAPALLMIGKRRVNDPRVKPNAVLTKLADLALGRPKAVIAVFLLVTLAVAPFIVLVTPNTGTIQSLKQGEPLRRAYEAVDGRMGGTMSLEVMLQGPEPDSIKSLEALKALEGLQNHLNENPLAMKTRSVLDVIKQLRQALHGDDPAHYALPESDRAVSEYLFLYETGGGAQLDSLVSFDSSAARLTLRTKSLDTQAIRAIMADTEKWAKEHLPAGYAVNLVGSIALSAAMCDYVSLSVAMSLSLAFVAVTLMLMLLLRSVWLGLLSMVPNVLPAVFAFGLMGVLGIDLHLSLAVLAPVILGVSVDDTVHFFHRFLHGLRQGATVEDSLRQTIIRAGRAMLFTSLVLVLGFSVFVFSSSGDYVDFAIVAAAAFTYALLADLLLAPAMLRLLQGVLFAKARRPEAKES
ncbi:MMPL domain protein [Desulfarculus baarsii DSM 2075]|uniref:MMPL domain protein n=1 Tax=Desulfarculus baarsii (strain ATCC 33931 / DSM 2075 / LMG 7858 / VKM B-1802 / 2st14) TaxID=644282 RepID=E1QJ69_DESB2|nr:MMPL family transporter [Desulfarculus baarsii]ADK85612.1 MMPL domain protein [Desulfarculus baarsii DSM 2075]